MFDYNLILILMPSYDGIMKHKYYEGTSKIINLASEIGKLLGVVDSTYLRKPTAKLRKANRIKSIHSSLWIEGNTLSVEQVTAIIENRKVLGPSKEILEVQNAIEVYEQIQDFSYNEKKSYLKAHLTLMKGLVADAGNLRTRGVGIFNGEQIAHLAPPAWNVDNLMTDLFKYLNESEDNFILKSCVFHYEMEFIHPFMDGNGRMGRLWQTVILMQENPVFEYLPIEHEIKLQQKEYYEALAISDKKGVCTDFVEYMMGKIKGSLVKLLEEQRVNLSDSERQRYFKSHFDQETFVRKDYMSIFKNISSATATRDLKKGIEGGLWEKMGENRTTIYKMK